MDMWTCGERAARPLAGAVMLLACSAAPVRADAYRLKAEAIGQARPSAGLLVLEGDGKKGEFVSAEALVWTGAGLRQDANVLVAAVRAHDRRGRAELRVGRLVVMSGALRPVHLDGAVAGVRAPGAIRIEAFGGSPVVAGAEGRSADWAAGGRVSRALGLWGSLGVGYYQQRDAGRRAHEETGVDASAALASWWDAGGRVAWDLISRGLSEAQITTSFRLEPCRLELFGLQRTASRLLPATSLFSVLGDVASRQGGATLLVRAAPRLDVTATGGVRAVGDSAGPSGTLASTLRLDDEGQSAARLEGRREYAPEGGWTGVRAAVRVALAERWRGSTELEVALPDEPRGRGSAWPWGLLAVTWLPGASWQLGAALLASASPEHTSEVDALVRASYGWGAL